MGSFLPDGGSYELLAVIGTWRATRARTRPLRFHPVCFQHESVVAIR
ncbi:hypothetical protein EYF80_063352 [Liparis tanakae]|uniref:Uncharacterized protein n=1 Tax=Liparis tanakae TaxID=230148 RepID=A0A4Z2ECN9_9TELE|nr:hypothetical protein EYF80_063352 [Liparis tanakae]